MVNERQFRSWIRPLFDPDNPKGGGSIYRLTGLRLTSKSNSIDTARAPCSKSNGTFLVKNEIDATAEKTWRDDLYITAKKHDEKHMHMTATS